MLEEVSLLGVEGFYTYHMTEGETFRPCATRETKIEAIKATELERRELDSIFNGNFPEVLFGKASLGDFLLPIHLHPFMWQKRVLQDVEWYNRMNVGYVPFYHYKTGKLKYIPKELTIYDDKRKGTGLTFSPQEGYSFDYELENAKLKAMMELIEKDVTTLWWHRETSSEVIIIDEGTSEEVLSIAECLTNQNIKLTLLNIKNNLGVYVIVSILEQDDYPRVAYGSAAHFDIVKAVKHSIFEAISCIAGLRYEFINFKRINTPIYYPDFISNSESAKISDFPTISDTQQAISEYDIYYSYISINDGYLVKAYSFELQSSLYCDTVPLTKRFFTASDTDAVVKAHFPFL